MRMHAFAGQNTQQVGTITLDFQPFCGHQISCIVSKHVSVVQVRLDYRITQTLIYSGDLKSYPSNTETIKKLGFLKVVFKWSGSDKNPDHLKSGKNGIQNLASLEQWFSTFLTFSPVEVYFQNFGPADFNSFFNFNFKGIYVT